MENIFKLKQLNSSIYYNILDKKTNLNFLIINKNFIFSFVNILNYINLVLGKKIIFINFNKFKKIEKSFFGLLTHYIFDKNYSYTINLTIQGLGYYFDLDKNILKISVGYSHIIKLCIPLHIKLKVYKAGTLLEIKGYDKSILGLVAAKIKSISIPDVYKGKGIRYSYEQLKLKNIKH